jgi:hypothetical protein
MDAIILYFYMLFQTCWTCICPFTGMLLFSSRILFYPSKMRVKLYLSGQWPKLLKWAKQHGNHVRNNCHDMKGRSNIKMKLYYQGKEWCNLQRFCTTKWSLSDALILRMMGGINEATRALINDHITKKILTQPCIIARCVF